MMKPISKQNIFNYVSILEQEKFHNSTHFIPKSLLEEFLYFI
jgi:hypothetical protein